MERMTRVKKYKELRDSMKEEVSIERQQIVETVEEDDFLDFIPKPNKEVNIEDTLMNPLSYETLEESPKEVKDALNIAKMNVGKNQYDTRLDILNRIKAEEKINKQNELKDSDFSNGHVVKQSAKKMTLLEKLASMSPEEDVKELEKFEQSQHEEKKVMPVVEPKIKNEEINIPKEVIKEENKEIINDETEGIKLFNQLIDEENKQEIKEEKSDKLLTVLNTIIIILIIAFICFIGVFAYQLFF